MRLTEMRALVRAELAHIPDWPKPHQSELRMSYWLLRMHSLGKKARAEKSALEVLQECITVLRQQYPDVQFDYDAAFFRQQGHLPRTLAGSGQG